jgi:mitogen-activated protein kinase kinase kinase
MAPEVVKQTSYTRKADIWSLGCLVVEMFTGSHPFPDFSQMQAIFKVLKLINPPGFYCLILLYYFAICCCWFVG